MEKRFFYSIVAMMLLCLSVNAQRVVDVRRCEPVVNGKFMIMLDTVRVETSPLVYKLIESNPTAYCVVENGSDKMFFLRSALESPAESYVFEVASATLENDLPTVTMTSGYKFADPDLRWLAVQPGQHVKVSRYAGLTHEMALFETVSRDTPLSEGADVDKAMAPMKSQLPQMIGKVQADNQAKAKKAAEAKALADAEAKALADAEIDKTLAGIAAYAATHK